MKTVNLLILHSHLKTNSSLFFPNKSDGTKTVDCKEVKILKFNWYYFHLLVEGIQNNILNI